MFGIFTTGQHFGSIVVLFLRKLVAVRESHFPVRIRATLGRNQDHTGGCTCSVDSTGRSIFQHIDRLDIILRQRTDITPWETIDHDKRCLSGIDGSHTAKLESRTGIGTSQVIHHQTADLTLQGRRDIRPTHTDHQVIGFQRGDGAGHLLLVQRTIADHHDFFQCFGIFNQLHMDGRLVAYLHFLSYITDKRNH